MKLKVSSPIGEDTGAICGREIVKLPCLSEGTEEKSNERIGWDWFWIRVLWGASEITRRRFDFLFLSLLHFLHNSPHDLLLRFSFRFRANGLKIISYTWRGVTGCEELRKKSRRRSRPTSLPRSLPKTSTNWRAFWDTKIVRGEKIN